MIGLSANPGQTIKKCTKCNKNKLLNNNNFYFRKKRNTWNSECIKCESIRKRNWEKKNKEKLSNLKKSNSFKEKKAIMDKNYYQKNKKKILDQKKEYRQKNKEKRNVYEKQKRKDNPIIKARSYITNNINKILKRQNGSKYGYSIMNYLPYSMEDLKAHLESQFESWMTWNNWGPYKISEWNDSDSSTWKWNIDHIIPQSDLLYDSMEHPNFQKCWALENLRPLCAKQNLLKNNNLEQ